MRPIYETQADLDNEIQVRDALSRVWNVSFHKMPRAYNIDWLLVDQQGNAKAFVELKCRSTPKDQYPTLMLSLHKWMHGKTLAREINGVFLIAVRWTDGLYYCIPEECEGVTYGVGGRTDRGDSQDVEPVVHIPNSCFKQVSV